MIMMCSTFLLHKTLQSLNKEVLFELDQITYPLIPFEIKRRECCHLKMTEVMQCSLV